MTDTDRDVARRRRRWYLEHGVAQVALLTLTAAAIWLRGGWVAGVLATLMLLNVAVTCSAHGVQYRLGYWRGRIDVREESTQRALGIEPVSCEHAEPWSPPPGGPDIIDLVRAFTGRRR